MGDHERPPVAIWLETVASVKGPDHPQVRATLLALGTFMNGEGSTYVSLEALAVCAALHPRRVRLLIRSAEKSGWLASAIERQGRQRAWRLKTYRAIYPAGISPAGREDRKSSRQRQVRTGPPRREDQASNDVRTPGPSKSPIEISKEIFEPAPRQKARAPRDLRQDLDHLPKAIAEPAKRISDRFATRRAEADYVAGDKP